MWQADNPSVVVRAWCYTSLLWLCPPMFTATEIIVLCYTYTQREFTYSRKAGKSRLEQIVSKNYATCSLQVAPLRGKQKKLAVLESQRLCFVLHILIVVVSTNLHGYKGHCPALPHVRYSWGTILNRRDKEMPPYGGII